jgi:DNA polymerase I-like protein with 3'-5' exonuclease and polymerase domains
MATLEFALKKIQDVSATFLAVKPEVADFTSDTSATLNIMAEGLNITIPLSGDVQKLKVARAKIRGVLSKIIIGWDIKELFTFILGKTGVPFEIDAKIYDLKILEWYLGIEGKCPQSFEEAKSRLSKVVKHSSWEKLKNIYQKVYIPLISEVIPAAESLGVINHHLKRRLYSHYEIAGQVNGRLKCNKSLRNGFNPHSMGEAERQVLRPPFFDYDFIYLDYHNMEVGVLQWLSGDPLLGQILETGKVYEGIWTALTGIDYNENYRRISKSIFLPVVYGQGVDSLAKNAGMSNGTAVKLIDRIYKKFSVAMQWIQQQQQFLVNGQGVDVAGRCRFFDETYKVRNFVVQSPAALFCLEKLVQLYKGLKYGARLAFHIHDGYVLYAPRLEVERVGKLAIDILETESEIFKGLKLKVSCKAGESIETIKDIRRK